jgi:hypothetical protein
MKQLDLEDFPPYEYQYNETDQPESLSAYLELFLIQNCDGVGEKITLPSLSELASFFHCSRMEVHDAFQRLRKVGFDYFFHGIDYPIDFWKEKELLGHEARLLEFIQTTSPPVKLEGKRKM